MEFYDELAGTYLRLAFNEGMSQTDLEEILTPEKLAKYMIIVTSHTDHSII